MVKEKPLFLDSDNAIPRDLWRARGHRNLTNYKFTYLYSLVQILNHRDKLNHLITKEILRNVIKFCSEIHIFDVHCKFFIRLHCNLVF